MENERGGPRTPRAFLDVSRNGSNSMAPVTLTGSRQVVGRNPDLAIVLDHESVSRLHGEFVRDPYGRWWIHDLGSTNGTMVNGSQITQRLLNPGDVIHLGDYTIRFRIAGSESNRERLSVTEPPPAADRRSTKRLMAVSKLGINAAHLASTMEFGRELAEIEDQHKRLTALCRFTVSERFNGTRAWVVQVDVSAPASVRVKPVHRTTVQIDDDTTELEVLAKRHQPLLVRDAGPHVVTWEPGGTQRTAVICSVDAHPEGFSALYVEFDSALFTEEWKHMVGMLIDAYHQANVAWEMRGHVRASAKVDHELEMARQIQDSLVPKSPSIEGLELALGYEPCQWVGGDYVDAVSMADGRWLLAVADVCGKGLSAALVASSLHTLVHVTVSEKTSLSQLVGRMNSHLYKFLPIHSFVTFVCIAIDPTTGLMECINAGHPPPIVVEKGGKVTRLQSERNVALGMAEADFVSECTVLCEGDVLFMYTDGLTEAQDPERRILGTDGLQREVQRIATSLPDLDLETMRRRLFQAVAMHRGTLMATDDTTFMIARLGSRPPLMNTLPGRSSVH